MTQRKCAGRGQRGLTWSEERSAYGVLIRSGLTPEEIKKLRPCCRKCAVIVARRPVQSVQSVKSVVQETLSTTNTNQ